MNPLQLWDEVIQGESVLSEGKSIETILKFPNRIIINGKSYDEVKVGTTEENNRCKNTLYVRNPKEWKPLTSFEPKEDEMYEVHSDKLIWLRGEYVKQHKGGLKSKQL